MLSSKEQFEEQIGKAQNILITAPANESRDSLANALALFLFLRRMEKNVDLVIGNLNEKKSLNFLPGFNDIKNSPEGMQNLVVTLDISKTKVDQVKYIVSDDRLKFIISPKGGNFTGEEVTSCACDYKYDLIITVGAPDLESLGKVYEENADFFYKTPIINIDNDSSNESYGQINIIELTAVSISQILFPQFKAIDNNLINEDIATCLLAGIIGKTRNFRTQGVSPQVLEATSDLIAQGARKDEIINNLYRSRTFNVLKLWGRVLARLQSLVSDQLIWSILSQADFIKTESREEDLNEVIDELISSVPTAKVIALIFENGNGKTKAWVYSGKSINSLELTADFNSSGGRNLAKFELGEPLQAAEKAIISKLEDKLKVILEKE